jgi:hypothetical protein
MCSLCSDQLSSGEDLDEHSDSDSDISGSEEQAIEILIQLEKEDLAMKNKTGGVISSKNIGEISSIISDSDNQTQEICQVTLEDSAVSMCISQVTMDKTLVAKVSDMVATESSLVTKETNLDDSAIVVGCEIPEQSASVLGQNESFNTKCDGICNKITEPQHSAGCSVIQSKSVCQNFGLLSDINEGICNHFIFDINRAIDVIENMIQNEDFHDMDTSDLVADPEQFLWQLNHFMKHFSKI